MRRPVAVALLAIVGCAPKTGWERTTARVCDEDQPATLCLEARPDQAIEARVGGEVILPGECAVAPERGGNVRVEIVENGASERVWVRAPKGKQTTIVRARGEKRVDRVRRGCDRRPS